MRFCRKRFARRCAQSRFPNSPKFYVHYISRNTDLQIAAKQYKIAVVDSVLAACFYFGWRNIGYKQDLLLRFIHQHVGCFISSDTPALNPIKMGTRS